MIENLSNVPARYQYLDLFFKGRGKVGERLLENSAAEVALPAVAVYELEVGLAKSTRPAKRRRQLDELIDAVVVIPFDRRAATAAAQVRATLEQTGQQIGPLDTLIAGITLAHGATLITHNTREFSRIPNLALEGWY